MMINENIFKITNKNELSSCLYVIHKSYEYRDKKMNLNKDEHRHTYLTIEDLNKMYDENIQMFGYYKNNKLIAFLSLKINEYDIKIKDIVVLPEYQNKGIGKELLDFAKQYAKENKKSKLKLGFIYNNTELKMWYEKNGFVLIEIKEYPNNKIGYMEYKINEIDVEYYGKNLQ